MTNKAIFLLKKKFVQRVSPAKKIPAQAEGEKKKKIVRAENPPPPPPPHHFSNGPSLTNQSAKVRFKENPNVSGLALFSGQWPRKELFTNELVTHCHATYSHGTSIILLKN